MKKILNICFALLLCFISTADFIQAKDKSDYSISTKYEFPIVEGTEEWYELKTQKAKIEATQIPIDILENMTTEALLETVLDYPLIGNLFAFNTFNQGFEVVTANFNGLEELRRRDDLNELIIKKLNSETYSTEDELLERMVLEIFLAQPEINSQNSSIEMQNFEKNLISEDKNSIYFLALMENMDIAPVATTTVKTPNGTSVEVIRNTSETLTDSQIDTINKQNDAEYPDATRLRSATGYYNCHSYAWYSTSSSNKYWMNDPSAYMEDGSYDEVSPMVNAKIYYYGEHSGIITSTSSRGITVTSKWGHGGLYRHKYDDCPYSVSDLSYWN